jgi:hypothetical protein
MAKSAKPKKPKKPKQAPAVGAINTDQQTGQAWERGVGFKCAKDESK